MSLQLVAPKPNTDLHAFYASREHYQAFRTQGKKVQDDIHIYAPAPLAWPYAQAPLLDDNAMKAWKAQHPGLTVKNPKNEKFCVKRDNCTVRFDGKDYALPLGGVERDSDLGQMLGTARQAYMQHASKLTRVSLNVRVGVLSGTRCMMDWDMCSKTGVYDKPLENGEGVRGVLGLHGTVKCTLEKGPASNNPDAWKALLGRYLGNVAVWGRYHNIPAVGIDKEGKSLAAEKRAAKKHNELVWSEWKKACEEFVEQSGNSHEAAGRPGSQRKSSAEARK